MNSHSRSTWHVRHPEQPFGEHAGVYLFPNGVYAILYSGDITKAIADAVVSEEPADLNPTNFVARALLTKSGETYRLDRWDLIRSYGELKYGQVYETRAGSGVDFFYTFHAIVTTFQEGREKEWLRCSHDLYKNIVRRADDKLSTTMAMPLLGTGSGGAPTHYAVDAFVQCMSSIYPRFLKKIFVINVDPNITAELKSACSKFIHQLSVRARLARPVLTERAGMLRSTRPSDASAKTARVVDDSSDVAKKSAVLGGAKSETDDWKRRVSFRDDAQSPDEDWSTPLRTLRERRLARSYDGSGFRDLSSTRVNDRFKEIPFGAMRSALKSPRPEPARLGSLTSRREKSSADVKLRAKTPLKTVRNEDDDSNKISDQIQRKRSVTPRARDTPDHAWDDPEPDHPPGKKHPPPTRSRRHRFLLGNSKSDKSELSSGRSDPTRSSGRFPETFRENPARFVDVDEWYRSNEDHPRALTKETEYGLSRKFARKPRRRSLTKRGVPTRDVIDLSRWETVYPKLRPKRKSLIGGHVWLSEAVNLNTAHDSDDFYSGSDSGNETDDELT